MRWWVWIGFFALLVLHQDLWLWADAELWLGPLPAGLAYHAGYSLVVALFWLAVVRFAWPAALDEPTSRPEGVNRTALTTADEETT